MSAVKIEHPRGAIHEIARRMGIFEGSRGYHIICFHKGCGYKREGIETESLARYWATGHLLRHIWNLGE